jgi:hypothetical protein
MSGQKGMKRIGKDNVNNVKEMRVSGKTDGEIPLMPFDQPYFGG